MAAQHEAGPPPGTGEDNAVDDDDDSSPQGFLRQLELMGTFAGKQDLLEQLRELAAQGVHPMEVLQKRRSAPMQEPVLARVLPSFDLEGIAQYVAEHSCKNMVVMCGAGISTSAGIPDFRTPGTGLYDNLQRFNLPRAESIFEMGFFRANPAAFYELAKDMWPGNYAPTPAHYFVRLLSDKGILRRCYTQNIDSLERQAGIPADLIVAAHGNFDAAHVIDTVPEVLVDINELKAAIDKGEEGWRVLCQQKGGLVKPKIVFFGESLPGRFAELRQADLPGCDLLIVMGTSLVVQPFGGLVGQACRNAPRLLLNRDPVGTFETHRMGFRFHLQDEKNWRDVFHPGDCDSGCRALAASLGWAADLEALIESKGSVVVSRAPWASEAG